MHAARDEQGIRSITREEGRVTVRALIRWIRLRVLSQHPLSADA